MKTILLGLLALLLATASGYAQADKARPTQLGITAGIDGTLGLVERYSGRMVADAVASILEYKWPSISKLSPAKMSKPAAVRHRTQPMPRSRITRLGDDIS